MHVQAQGPGVAAQAAARQPDRPVAPRPASSVLALDRIRATGFEPADAAPALEAYLKRYRDR